MEEKKQPNKKVYQILIIVFGIAFICCGIFLIRDYITKKNAEEQFQQLAQNTQQNGDGQTVPVEEVDILKELGVTIPDLGLDWEKIKEENEDIYAWIYIPETNVNYPILQHPTESDYYLDHNLDHSTGRPGCLYTQLLNSKQFTDSNTVIYGHNMKNGTMFKTLHNFESEEFFDSNRYIYIYTPEKTLVYEIYGACEYSNAHLLYEYSFELIGQKQQFLDDLKNLRGMNNQICEDMHTSAVENPLVTLSTCILNKPNNRWLVVGVLLDKVFVEE